MLMKVQDFKSCLTSLGALTLFRLFCSTSNDPDITSFPCMVNESGI